MVFFQRDYGARQESWRFFSRPELLRDKPVGKNTMLAREGGSILPVCAAAQASRAGRWLCFSGWSNQPGFGKVPAAAMSSRKDK